MSSTYRTADDLHPAAAPATPAGVLEAMLQVLEGGEQHTRPALELRRDSPFFSYIEIGNALRDCLDTPAGRAKVLARLKPHRSLIIGNVPAGLANRGLIPEIDAIAAATHDLRSLDQISDEELRQWLVEDGRLIYGEWKRFELANYFDALRGHVKPGALFVDLGSGLGKVVMSAALALPFGRCVGVELLEYRHKMALERAQAFLDAGRRGIAGLAQPLAEGQGIVMTADVPADAAMLLRLPERLAFLQGDMFQVDLAPADLVFLYSTCFAPLMDALGEKLAQSMREGALVTTTTFPLRHPGFRLLEHFPSGTISWTSVFLYERAGAYDSLPPAQPAALWEAEEAEWEQRAREELARLAAS